MGRMTSGALSMGGAQLPTEPDAGCGMNHSRSPEAGCCQARRHKPRSYNGKSERRRGHLRTLFSEPDPYTGSHLKRTLASIVGPASNVTHIDECRRRDSEAVILQELLDDSSARTCL